jgi:hypothetical protein
MPSKTEVSFGARITNAQNLLAVLQTLPNFSPQHADDTITGFEQLVISLMSANNAESTKETNYRNAVAARRQAYEAKNDSVTARIREIQNAVQNLYGKTSAQAKEINAVLKDSNNTKVVKKTTTLADGTTKTAKYSQSQKSFGSQLSFLSDMVAKVSAYANYTPIRPELQPAELNAFLAQVNSLNTAATTTKLEHTDSIKARRLVFDRLKQSGDRLKAYFLDAYGKDSVQHNFIKDLVF